MKEFAQFALYGIGVLFIALASSFDWPDDKWIGHSFTVIAVVFGVICLVIAMHTAANLK